MKLHRIVNGFVCQVFERQGHKHVCTEQHFHAADDTWETEDGNALMLPEDECDPIMQYQLTHSTSIVGVYLTEPKVFTPQDVEIVQPGTTLIIQIIDGGDSSNAVVQIKKTDTHELAMELAVQLASEYYGDVAKTPHGWEILKSEIVEKLQGKGSFNQDGLMLILQKFDSV
jgi:hypothetical protein